VGLGTKKHCSDDGQQQVSSQSVSQSVGGRSRRLAVVAEHFAHLKQVSMTPQNDQVKEDEMDRACSTNKDEDECI
jgi:hypothetical protein